MGKAAAFTEADMYPPVKAFFEKRGYTMRAEVQAIDATATLGDELLLFEFKKSFTMSLLYQAINRQRLSPLVYVVIPRQKKSNDANSKNLLYIVKKLGLGLITVAMDSPLQSVDILAEPEGACRIDIQKRNRVLKEVAARSMDGNRGGSSRKKLLTAFRERSIKVACVLYNYGEMSAKVMIRAYECPKDAYNIVRSNYYGWFQRLDKGIYGLSPEGRAELENPEGQFKEAVAFYMREVARFK